MTDAGDDLAQTSPMDDLETMEDFRAKATAFSQLTGVLGGFSLTILVLVLGLDENKTARDWTVGLLLLAATAYIFASGYLANSMNVGALAKRQGDRRKIRAFQGTVFNIGIGMFHTGNVLLPIAILITVSEESLRVGLAASIVIVLLAAGIVAVNLIQARRILQQAVSEYIDDEVTSDGEPESANSPDKTEVSPSGRDVIDSLKSPAGDGATSVVARGNDEHQA